MAVVQSWVLVKVRLWLGITVLVRPRLSDSGDVAKTMSRELQSARVLNKGVVSSGLTLCVFRMSFHDICTLLPGSLEQAILALLTRNNLYANALLFRVTNGVKQA